MVGDRPAERCVMETTPEPAFGSRTVALKLTVRVVELVTLLGEVMVTLGLISSTVMSRKTELFELVALSVAVMYILQLLRIPSVTGQPILAAE